ncbi:MAG: serine--tRNA ligase, partial [Gammaproteobacteria bacterium]
MLDPKRLRNDLESTARLLARRGFHLDVEEYARLEDKRKSLQVETEALRNERNERSKAIGKAKAAGQDIEPLKKEVGSLGAQLAGAENELREIQEQLDAIQLGIPNLLADDVPDGSSEDDNVEIRRWGEPRSLDFEPLDHVDVGARVGGMDFERAAQIAGARFVVLEGPLARLHRALIQFMLDMHTSRHGYREVYVPYLVNGASLTGTGQLPKF